MADASALPTDDDQQLGPTSASLEASGAGSEPPGETPRESPGESAAPAEFQVESQGEEVEAAAGEAPASEAAEAPQSDLAPEAEPPSPSASETEPSEPDQAEAEPTAVKPSPGPSFAVAIPSFSSPEPALSFASVAKPAQPSPEPTAVPAPVQPAPLPPEAEPAVAAWAAPSTREPEPVVPEPAPEPEPEAVPVTPPPVPTVATTIDLPARGDGAATGTPGEGGEWALLLSKLQAWLGSGQLQSQLQAARTPLTLVAGLIALVVVLQIYGALLGVIGRFPLAPGLLELVGLITVVRFGLTKLVRSQERRALIEGLQQRWQAFRGQA